METSFKDFVPIQKAVNKVVKERLDEQGIKHPGGDEYLLAMQVEFFEFINELQVWKWWKHNKAVNKDEVLDELADVIAFFTCLLIEFNLGASVDELITEISDSLADHGYDQIIYSAVMGIEQGEEMNFHVLMSIALALAESVTDATWEEIELAYMKKSEINIKRQQEGY